MTLLRKIQDAAVSSSAPITDLLRSCKILATRLGSNEFAQWVDHELNGYPDKQSLPTYRTQKTASAGHFSGPFGSGLRNAEIPLICIPEKYRENISTAYITQPISALSDLLEAKEASSFQIPWNTSLTALVGQQIYEGMNCLSAWQVIPRGSVIGLIDTVRNRILNFALEIEKMAPQAGEAAPDSKPLSENKVEQVFHNHIYGNVGNIASGNHTVSQSAEIAVAQGDIASLRSQLLGMGFKNEDIRELETALAEDASKEPKKLGSAIGRWLGGAMTKAGNGMLKVSASTASSLLTKLIAQYLGIPH